MSDYFSENDIHQSTLAGDDDFYFAFAYGSVLGDEVAANSDLKNELATLPNPKRVITHFKLCGLIARAGILVVTSKCVTSRKLNHLSEVALFKTFDALLGVRLHKNRPEDLAKNLVNEVSTKAFKQRAQDLLLPNMARIIDIHLKANLPSVAPVC